MEGSVFGSKILPAILIMVPATVLVSVQASLSEPAAEECKTSPGTNAPRGAHWYYHVNRAKQHCWYLGVVDAHARAQAVTPAASTAATASQKSIAAEPVSAAAAPAAPVATAPAPAMAAQSTTAPAAAAPALPETLRGAGFVTRWPENLPNAEGIEQQEPAAISSSYAEGREATGQVPQMPSTLLVPGTDHMPAGSAGEVALRYFSIAGALAIPLLLAAGWGAKFARRRRRPVVRDQWRTIATPLSPRRHLLGDELIGIAPLVVDRHGDADGHAPVPTDPAYDLKTSLAELMRDLRRAGAFEPVQAAEQSAEPTELPSDQPTRQPSDEPAELPSEPADESGELPAQQMSDEETSDQDYYPVLEAAE
jgi:hypothetical protein